MDKAHKIGVAETETQIRALAYKLWEEDGYPTGCAEFYWMKACQMFETEVDSKSVLKLNSNDEQHTQKLQKLESVVNEHSTKHAA